jgi:Glucodextranase, domain B
MVIRVALVAAVLALCAGVLYVGVNGFGIVAGGIGSTLSGFVAGVTSTPSPRPVVQVISDPPSIEQPTEPYTSEATADLVVTVPASLAGSLDHRIKVYLALAEQPLTPIQESPIADAAKTIIPVRLEKGINDFSVSIVGPAGESEKSAVVRFVLDDAPPKITVTSPKNNATVNGKAVTIKGKTQARTTLLARNDASGSSIAGTAGPDGTFTLSLALSPGVNTIAITGTDPAGNVTEIGLNVKRGAGKLTAKLTSSTYQIKRSRLPEPVTLSATVTDPDGQPLAATDITFTLSMPGIPTVTIDGKTSADGKASFSTTIPKGADVGQGSATVLVTSKDFGSTQDYTVISITK